MVLRSYMRRTNPMFGLKRFFSMFCILALIAVFLACFCGWSPGLSPGEHGTYIDEVLIVAAVGMLVPDIPLYATLQETCRRFGCGMSKLYEEISAGKIEAKKWGKRVLVNQASAKAYFDALPPATSTIRLPHARRRADAKAKASA
jgi:hypothetical protein